MCLFIFAAIVAGLIFYGMIFGYRSLPPFLEMGSVTTTIGYPVWSNSNSNNNNNNENTSKIAGIEKQWNEGIVFPPLQGFIPIGQVNPRFKVFTQTGTDSSTRIDLITIRDHATSLFYMENAGYILVNRLEQPQELRSSIIVKFDNVEVEKEQEEELLSNLGLNKPKGSYVAIPSRDGSVIAAAAWDESEMNIVLVDVSTFTPLLNPSILTLSKSQITPLMFWDPDTTTNTNNKDTFIVYEPGGGGEGGGNSNSRHTRIGSDGTVEESTDTIVCTPYPTSSGRIREGDGMFVSVNTELNEIELSFVSFDECTSIYGN